MSGLEREARQQRVQLEVVDIVILVKLCEVSLCLVINTIRAPIPTYSKSDAHACLMSSPTDLTYPVKPSTENHLEKKKKSLLQPFWIVRTWLK